MTTYRIHEVPGSADSFLIIGGIKWKTLLGNDVQRKSLAEAKANKATHYVPAGAVSSSVGTIILPSEKGKKKSTRKLYSAAAVFAQGHATGAFITKVEVDGQYWVVAVHEGNIAKNTDVLCDGIDADELIADFKGRHPTAALVDRMSDVSEYLNSFSQLIAPKSAYESVPISAKWTVLVLAALLAANLGWDAWKQRQARLERSKRVEQTIDARAEWKKALDNWQRGIELDGPAGLSDVYREATHTPLNVGLWNLSSGECRATPKEWVCSARYERAALATNDNFAANLPKGWIAGWDGLNFAVGTWKVPATRTGLKRDVLPLVADFSVQYISELQYVLAAYRKVELTVPTTVPIREPRVAKLSGEVAKVPYPATDSKGLEIPKVQHIKLSGPLRSFSVLPIADSTRIQYLMFTVEGRGVRPNIRTSVFMADLEGDIYVK